MEWKNSTRMAVLIDADNVPYKSIAGILAEVSKIGTVTLKRIYGDWTSQSVVGWKNVLHKYAITPIQQYAYTTGKNATDSAMIIDAMDILYEGNMDGFCIVSSDSDFTRLAVRLRESGNYVLGIGERKTPEAFIASCDKFVYIEVIDAELSQSASVGEKMGSEQRDWLIRVISQAINDLSSDDNAAVFLGDLGNYIIKKHPDFDARNYGFYQLTPLIKSLNAFTISEQTTENPNVKHVYIKNK